MLKYFSVMVNNKGVIHMQGLFHERMEREQTFMARRQIQLSVATLMMLVAITVTMLYSLLLMP